MIRLLLAVLLAMSAVTPRLHGYAVLAHEAIIDAAWKDHLAPLLMKRFPNTTPEELRQAQAYAYGGAIIQDLGYFSFQRQFFSDLTHYVRSGDFIANLVAESQNLNEYAFALGALAHYAADNDGHRFATNAVVPMMYPKLKQKFGDSVNYEQDHTAHLKVEFAFDVTQVALGYYAPAAYHQFIGFAVARPVLDRAFEKTYGIPMSELFADEDKSIGTYRYAISTLVPNMTRIAWNLKKKQIVDAHPDAAKRKFLYNISHSEFHKDWGPSHEEPTFKMRCLAFFIRVVPKIGPFKALGFSPVPEEGEKLFMKSFDRTLDQYKKLLANQGKSELKLPNENFDTGLPVVQGEYHLTDQTYARLLTKLDGKTVPSDVRADILAYYSKGNAILDAKQQARLATLQLMPSPDTPQR